MVIAMSLRLPNVYGFIPATENLFNQVNTCSKAFTNAKILKATGRLGQHMMRSDCFGLRQPDTLYEIIKRGVRRADVGGNCLCCGTWSNMAEPKMQGEQMVIAMNLRLPDVYGIILLAGSFFNQVGMFGTGFRNAIILQATGKPPQRWVEVIALG